MVKEGYWYGLPLALVAAGCLYLGLQAPAAVFLLLCLFVLNFFRDPERAIPSEADALVSPADGRVVEVADDDFAGRAVRRVSIFMSPFNVHVNRAPIEGVIESIEYQPGRFHVASRAEASVENEQNIFAVEGRQGRVVVKQIAGLLARRIVFWKKKGDRLERGERVGLIKFGSRVDVLVEPAVKLLVKRGDRVRAGSSVLGTTRPAQEGA